MLFRMNSLRLVGCCLVILPVVGISCSKKDKETPVADEVVEGVDPTAAPTAEPTEAPSNLASTPAEAVSLLAEASQSAGGKMGSMVPAGASLFLADGEEITGCSKGAQPVSGDSSRDVSTDEFGNHVLPSSDPGYALGKFYCTIAQDSGNEGSVRGAMSLPKAVTCLVGDRVVYDGEEHAFEVTLTDSACFGGQTPEGMPATVTMKVTSSKPALGAGAGWDSSHDIGLHADGQKLIGIKMFMKSTPTQVAVAFQGGGTATDAYSFNLDTEEGTLRYEGKFLRIPQADSQGWSDHTRILIRGAVESDGSFSSLVGVEGAMSSIYAPAGSSVVENGQLMTIMGDEEKGYRTWAYTCGGDAHPCNGQSLEGFSAITGSGTCDAGPQSPTCEGNEGLKLDDVGQLKFLMRPAEEGFEDSATWISSLSPLAFTHVLLEQSQE